MITNPPPPPRREHTQTTSTGGIDYCVNDTVSTSVCSLCDVVVVSVSVNKPFLFVNHEAQRKTAQHYNRTHFVTFISANNLL